MTFEDYYKEYLKYKDYDNTFCSGNNTTVEEFYKDCIFKTQLDVQLVEKWHNMFIKYISLPDAIFWIRKYESGGTKGNWDNRRACLTKYKYKGKNRYYVTVSNFDVQDIFNMIYMGIEPPKAEKFLKLMKNFEYKFHYDDGKTSAEKDFAAYPRVDSNIQKLGSLSANNWYLAHIHGIFNDNYISKNEGKRLFPDVKEIDWKYDKTLNKWCRDLNIEINDEEYKIMIASFLRFVDPINYYIVPNRNCEINDIYSGRSKISIGEYHPLSYYVYENNYIYNNRKVIAEFEKMALVNYQKEDFGGKVINIAYRQPSKKVSEKKERKVKKVSSTISKSKSKSPAKISISDKIKVVKAFLFDSSHTYRSLDCMLGYPNNHGSVSHNLVKEFKDKKGILSKETIDDEIKNASGKYKEWLVLIKDDLS